MKNAKTQGTSEKVTTSTYSDEGFVTGLCKLSLESGLACLRKLELSEVDSSDDSAIVAYTRRRSLESSPMELSCCAKLTIGILQGAVILACDKSPGNDLKFRVESSLDVFKSLAHQRQRC